MDTEDTLRARLGISVTRWLVRGPATKLIVAGTLAFAGFGAALATGAGADLGRSTVGSVPAPLVPSYPPGSRCFQDPDGDGHIKCYVDAGQLSAFSNAYCYPDPDGDGHYVCYLDQH